MVVVKVEIRGRIRREIMVMMGGIIIERDMMRWEGGIVNVTGIEVVELLKGKRGVDGGCGRLEGGGDGGDGGGDGGGRDVALVSGVVVVHVPRQLIEGGGGEHGSVLQVGMYLMRRFHVCSAGGRRREGDGEREKEGQKETADGKAGRR